MTVEELRKKELWVIVGPDGEVDTSGEQDLFTGRDAAEAVMAAYYDPEDGFRVERLGRVAPEVEEAPR